MVPYVTVSSGAAAADLEPGRGGGTTGALVLVVQQELLRSLDDLVWEGGSRVGGDTSAKSRAEEQEATKKGGVTSAETQGKYL